MPTEEHEALVATKRLLAEKEDLGTEVQRLRGVISEMGAEALHAELLRDGEIQKARLACRPFAEYWDSKE